jgi:CheY-like chemotaxis protein
MSTRDIGSPRMFVGGRWWALRERVANRARSRRAPHRDRQLPAAAVEGVGDVDPARVGEARILLAGGDAAQARMIRRALEIDGCEVVPCATGPEAVSSLLLETPDLILVNAPLREGTAGALLRWARARPATADVSCLVIAPAGAPHVVASLYDAGADLVITRPTELDLLSRRVAAVLARRPLALRG